MTTPLPTRIAAAAVGALLLVGRRLVVRVAVLTQAVGGLKDLSKVKVGAARNLGSDHSLPSTRVEHLTSAQSGRGGALRR